MAKTKQLAAEVHNQDDVLKPGSAEARAREILEDKALTAQERLDRLGSIWAAQVPPTAAPSGPAPSGQPLLSICIPTYQRAEYLFALLMTLAEQFAADPRLGAKVEVVVMDNASADLTAGVSQLAQSAIPQFAYHRNEFNIGPDANFFKVLAQARGEYEWLLGDDELVLPGGLTRIVEELTRHAPDHLYLNFQVLNIKREQINANYLNPLGRKQHNMLGLLKKIGYVRGFALISAHVFRTAPFRANCEPDLIEAMSYYPLLPVLLKAFAASGHSRQIFEPTFAHRVNNRFPDQLAVNHTRVLGLLRVLILLMDKYRVLTPTDVQEIFEYASENHTGWFLVDELRSNCENLLGQKYDLPIDDLDTIQHFFEQAGGRRAWSFLQALAGARSTRDKPIMARAAIRAKSARFSALFLVENDADLRTLSARLPSEDRFRHSVEMIAIMVNWPLSEEVVACFDQVIAVPQHLVENRVDLLNQLAVQARSAELLFLPVHDAVSEERAIRLLLEAYAIAATPAVDPDTGIRTPLPAHVCLASAKPPRATLNGLSRRAITGVFQSGFPGPELTGLGISRRLFFKFRGCDLMLYKDRPSYGLLDLAFRSRSKVIWQITGPPEFVPPAAVGPLAAFAAGTLYFVRSFRRFPIQESEPVRAVRLKMRGARRPRVRPRFARLSGMLLLLGRESVGFVWQWRREARSARKVVLKWFGATKKKP